MNRRDGINISLYIICPVLRLLKFQLAGRHQPEFRPRSAQQRDACALDWRLL